MENYKVELHQQHYRRGAIMGLTVAEAFMLISFALLLLFLLWRFEYETVIEVGERFQELSMKERTILDEILAAQELESIYVISEAIGSASGNREELMAGMGQLAVIYGALSGDQREALHELANPESIENVKRMDALFDIDSTEFASQLEEIQERWRLMDEEQMRRIAEAVAELPEDSMRELGNLVSTEGVEDTLEQFAALQELLAEGRTMPEILEAIEVGERFQELSMKERTILDEILAAQELESIYVISEAIGSASGNREELMAGMGQLAVIYGALSGDQREALHELANPESIENVKRMDALFDIDSTEFASQLEEIQERWRLMDEEQMRRIAEAVAELPEDSMRELGNLVSTEGVEDTLEQFAALQELLAEGRTMPEILEAIEVGERFQELSMKERTILDEILAAQELESIYVISEAIGSASGNREELMAGMGQLAVIYGALSGDQREALHELANPESIENVKRMDALFDIDSTEFASQLEEIQERWRLMDEEQMRRIAEAVAELPEDSMRELGNLVSTEGVEDTLEQFAALQELLAEGRTMPEILEAIEVGERFQELSMKERTILDEILAAQELESIYVISEAIGSASGNREELMAGMGQLAVIYGALSGDQREALHELANPESIENVKRMDALFDIDSTEFASQLEEIQERWRLMDEEQMRRIAEAVAELPEDSMRELGNLVSTEGVEDTLEQFAALQELLAEGRTMPEILEAIEVGERFQELSMKERTILDEILAAQELESIYVISEAIGSASGNREELMAGMGQLAVIYGALSGDQREALHELANPESIENVKRMDALFDIDSTEFASQLEEIQERWRLMDEEQMRRIAEAVAELPEDSMRELGNLVSTEGVEDTLEQFAALQELLAEGRTMPEILEAIEVGERFQELSMKERTILDEILAAQELESIYVISEAIGSASGNREELMAGMGQLAVIYGALSGDQREALHELANPESIENVKRMDALFDIDSTEFASQLEEIQERWRLMDEEQMRRIAEAVAELPEDSMRELGNLVSTEGVEDTLEQFAALQELLAEGRTMPEILEAIEVGERFQELSMKERTILDEILAAQELESIYVISEAIGSASGNREELMAGMGQLAVIYGALSGDQREALHELANPESIENVKRMDALFDIDSTEFASQLEEIQERWRLMDEEQMRRIAEAVAELPEDSMRELGNLVSTEGVEDTLEQFAALQELLAEGRTMPEILEAIEVGDEIAKSGYRNIDELKTRISSSLADERTKTFRLAEDLRTSLGKQVAEFGGNILEDGTIVLPSSVSFSRGSDEMTQKFALFLSRACEPWVKTLANSEQQISEVRFEGHASVEWEGALSDHDAFLRNLRLSQDRAQTVLATCLELIEDKYLRDWTEKRATAIGYSSARPVMKPDGTPDAAGSRRVVFSTSSDLEQVFQEIESAVTD